MFGNRRRFVTKKKKKVWAISSPYKLVEPNYPKFAFLPLLLYSPIETSNFCPDKRTRDSTKIEKQFRAKIQWIHRFNDASEQFTAISCRRPPPRIHTRRFEQMGPPENSFTVKHLLIPKCL